MHELIASLFIFAFLGVTIGLPTVILVVVFKKFWCIPFFALLFMLILNLLVYFNVPLFIIIIIVLIVTAPSLYNFIKWYKNIKNSIYYHEENLKKRQAWLVYVVITLLVVSALFQLDPLRWSPNTIRTNILRHTPIGMNMDDAVLVIRGSGHYHDSQGTIRSILVPWSDIGIYSHQTPDNWPQWHSDGFYRGDYFIIRYKLGEIRHLFFFNHHVIAAWIFDDDRILVDVEIIKIQDFISIP